MHAAWIVVQYDMQSAALALAASTPVPGASTMPAGPSIPVPGASLSMTGASMPELLLLPHAAAVITRPNARVAWTLVSGRDPFIADVGREVREGGQRPTSQGVNFPR